MAIGANASKNATGNDRGTGPVTTPGSPDTEMVGADEGEPGDFGYGAGAAEIRALFATRFREVRRTLPRHEVPYALAALADEKTHALEALKTRCQHDRLEARAALRSLQHQLRRPARNSPRMAGINSLAH